MNIAIFSRLVMIEQSLFCLPWVVASVLLALMVRAPMQQQLLSTLPSLSLCFWIVIAFTAARTAGMALNRLIDRHIDAANPRTALRPLQKGEITVKQVSMLSIVSLALFVGACAKINHLCLLLSPIVVILLCLYSYSKRYTALSHFVLGSIHFFSPIFAWAAVTNTLAWPPVFLGTAIWASIAGSDIIYALQDRQFDLEHDLHSIPAAIGVKRSIMLSKFLHALTAIFLVLIGFSLDLGPLFFAACAGIVGVYYYFHRLIDNDTSKIYRLFFYCNSTVVLVFMFSVMGIFLWRALS